MPTTPNAGPRPRFAPTADSRDGRERWNAKSRWSHGDWFQIIIEGLYLLAILAALPVAFISVWNESLRSLVGVSQHEYKTFQTAAYAVLGGVLGGTLFDLKWLYHSVARGTWHRDRLLWRIFTPMISGGLAFALVTLMASGIWPLLNTTKLRLPPVVVGTGFLVGYFSDIAIGAATNLAQRLFRLHTLTSGPSASAAESPLPIRTSSPSAEALSLSNPASNAPTEHDHRD